jgi:hypothetical protein
MLDRIIRAYQPAPSERQRRQNHVTEAAVPANREPTQADGEHIQQQDTEHELGG